MSVFNVKVKWGKQTHKVDLDTSKDTDAFKQKLFELTGVPVEKQKLVGKGVQVKSDTAWSKLKLKKNFIFALIGQAGPLPQAPTAKTIFVEDLPEDQRLAAEALLPPGLTNLGNTCYMNSTLQALSAIPELSVSVKKYNGGSALVSALGQLFLLLGASGEAVTPSVFLQRLRQIFPRFAERGDHGYAQQDAEECWTELLQQLARDLTVSDDVAAAGMPKTLVHQLFGLRMIDTLRNEMAADGADDEMETRESVQLKLPVNITREHKYLQACIEHSLSGQLEKTSANGGLAVFSKVSRIARLPLCLSVQFVRFFWKAGIDGKPGNKAKVTKPVDFPFRLDVFEFCTDELKAQLKPVRQRLRVLEAKRLGVAANKEDIDAMAEDKDDDDDAEDTMDEDGVTPTATVVKSPEFSCDTGMYDLHAVVTHKGRSADGGHYVAWVREADDQWVLFDDDKVTRVKNEDIKKLTGQGGSDWHLAYICLYRARNLASVVEGWKKEDEEKARNE